MDAGNHDARPQPNPFVVLDGTANSGCIGPAVGAFDIGESVSSYCSGLHFLELQKMAWWWGWSAMGMFV
ncbi:hypothetical protein Q3G72_027298 [Acer saccharum]|nr:hypothetical protein Q3G72_027298 [Acer saccharum]